MRTLSGRSPALILPPRERTRLATGDVHRGLDLRGRSRPEPIRRVIAALGANAVRQHGRAAGGPVAARQRPACRREVRFLHAEGRSIGGWEPRGAILAELQAAHGTLRVSATRLTLGRGKGIRLATLLLDAMRPRSCMPTPLLGDLKEWRAGQGALGLLEPVSGRAPHAPTFPSWRPLFSLGLILASRPDLVRGIAQHDVEAARRAPDHLPLVVRVAL